MHSTDTYSRSSHDQLVLSLPTPNLMTDQKPEEASRTYTYPGGTVIFDEAENSNAIYQVVSGEVVIIRHGQSVDLIETGEYLDAQIWQGASAIAWTHCVLAGVGITTEKWSYPSLSKPQEGMDMLLALAA